MERPLAFRDGKNVKGWVCKVNFLNKNILKQQKHKNSGWSYCLLFEDSASFEAFQVCPKYVYFGIGKHVYPKLCHFYPENSLSSYIKVKNVKKVINVEHMKKLIIVLQLQNLINVLKMQFLKNMCPT